MFFSVYKLHFNKESFESDNLWKRRKWHSKNRKKMEYIQSRSWKTLEIEKGIIMRKMRKKEKQTWMKDMNEKYE